MSSRKEPVSNLDFLIESGVLEKNTTLEDAIYILVDPLNCVECIALDQCADRYGTKTGEATEADCLEVVSEFLKQDHREESKE